MQEHYADGTYGEPKAVHTAEDPLGALLNPEVRRVVLFDRFKEDGKPTRETRRAWRRYRHNPHK